MSSLTLESEHCPTCGRTDLGVEDPMDAFARGRADQSWFWHYFLLRCPHPGQARFIEGAQATINALACSNRYGKTTLLAGVHYHANIFKTGGERAFLTPDGDFLIDEYLKLRYTTVHAAGEMEQTKEVLLDAWKLKNESPRLDAFIEATPKSMPYEIRFRNGSRWLLRTLGDNASGVDGKSFYVLSIDEAGWISDLQEMMDNVLTIRVADVRGRIIIVGTFKPGMSKDFFKICVKAAAATGVAIGFDHRALSEGDELQDDSIDSSIWKYAKECGFDLEAELAKARAEGTVL